MKPSTPRRLLLFLEPFPVRGHPADFMWVFDRWLPLVPQLKARGIEVVFAVSDTVQGLTVGRSPNARSPRDLGVEFTLPSDVSAQDQQWVQLMENPDVAPWRGFVEQLLDAEKPDWVITWTCNAPLAAACALRRIPLMHQELGPAREAALNLFFCDPRGVNGKSAVGELWEQLRAQPLTAAQRSNLNTLLSELFPPPATDLGALRRELGLAEQKRTVGVFLQVSRDSNVLAWSDIAGNAGLLERVMSAVEGLEVQVLVKAHPQEPAGALPLPAGVIEVPTQVPSRTAVELCDAVVCINSSVGFEALARGKSVFSYGKASWGVPGCTLASLSKGELRSALSGPNVAPDAEQVELRSRLLHFLLFKYFVPASLLVDPDYLTARLENWATLLVQGAPLAEYFQVPAASTRLPFLRQLAASRRELAEVAAQCALKQQEVATALGQVEASRRELAEAATQSAMQQQQAAAQQQQAAAQQQELAALQDALSALKQSAGHRLLDSVRRLPLIYDAYMFSKRALGRKS